MSDIFALCSALSAEHNLPLVLVYQESAGGFTFTLKKSDLEEQCELPRGFINVTQKKGKWVFGSLELVCNCHSISQTMILTFSARPRATRE